MIPLYTTQIQAFSSGNASLLTVVNFKLTAAFSSAARGLLVPLTHLQTLGSQTKHPALTIMNSTYLCGSGLRCLGLFKAELCQRPDEWGHSQQSCVSARARRQSQGGGWAFEIIGQFAGSLSASLNITLRQIFLNLDYSPCQEPLAVCQGP